MAASCTVQKQLSSIDYAGLYNSQVCNPQFKIYHFSKDSSLFYFSFSNKDLLFKKEESGFYKASLSLNYNLYTSYHSSVILDSATVIQSILLDSSGSGYTGVMKFKAALGQDYILKIIFKDINRNYFNTYIYPVKKTNPLSSQFFDMRFKDDQPFMENFVAANQKVKILPPENAPDSFFIRCYYRPFPLAPPPFSDTRTFIFDYSADSIYSIKKNSLNEIEFNREGFYQLNFDSITKNGFTVFCINDDFPQFTKPEQLIESLRYLCTREEYNELLSKKDKKKAIDDYWLTKAGNNERGRKLIKVYYNRSSSANKLFTSFLDGWKTDRGMIYIIFGPPRSVYRENKTETWRYSSSAGNPGLQFIFDKVNNPFTDNDYDLERSINYKYPWYQAVDAWRSGKIIGNY